ncbi:hypothetical protein ABPG74_016157 [Tetrahymena malaccensis]
MTNENQSVVPTLILIKDDAQLIIFVTQDKFIGLYDEVKNKMKVINTSEIVYQIAFIDKEQYLLAGMVTQASIFQIQLDSPNNDYYLDLKQTFSVDYQIFYILYFSISNIIFIFSPDGLIAVYQYLGNGNISFQNSFYFNQFLFLSAQATQDEQFIFTNLAIQQVAIFQIEKKGNMDGTFKVSNIAYLTSTEYDYWIVQLILVKNFLYCIDPWQGLYFTDLSPLYQNNTQAIMTIKFGLGSVNLSPTTQCMTVSSDLKYLYLAVRSQGILIYDISNITNPVFYYQIFAQGQAYYLIISNKGQALYYSNSNGLFQYQQTKLTFTNKIPNMYNYHKSKSLFDGSPFFKWRCQISQNSNVLYVSFNSQLIQRFQIIQSSQLTGDIILKQIDNLPYAKDSVNSTPYIEDICIDKNQNYLYIPVTNDNTIVIKYQIQSFANIFTPLLYIQSLQYSNPQYAESLKISQDNRYLVLAYTVGVLIVDNEKFEVLSLLNILEMQSNCYGAEFTRDTNYIFATARNIGVWIIDSRDKQNPFVIQAIKTNAAETVIVSELYDIMYCLDGSNGLLIFDTSVLPNVKMLSHLKLEGWVNYITLLQNENFGIISTMDSGMLSLINLTDKTNPYIISSYQIGQQNSYSTCVDPKMQYVFTLNSQSIRYFPIHSDTYIHYEFSVKQTNQNSQVRVVLNQDDYLQVGQIYELRLISLYQQPNQQINNIFIYQNEQKQGLPTWINQISKLYLEISIPKEAVIISSNSIITLLVQTQFSLSNSSFIYNSTSFAISPDLSNKIYQYLKTCAFLNSFDLVTDLYNPEVPLNFNDFGNDLTNHDQQILALKFVRNTLQNSIDYNPIYFRVQSSLNYIINQSNNTFQVYSISNTVSIQISFSPTSSLVFVQKEYPNVISYRDDQNTTLNLQSSVDSINNILRENILYHIIESQNNQNKQFEVNLLIQDNINSNIKAQFNVSDLSFLKLKQKVKQLKELQPQVEKVSSDSSFAIESTFIIQFDQNSFIDPDGIPLAYQLKIQKDNNYENILPEYFIKFDEQNLRISGIPQSSNLFETIRLRLVVSNGYNQLYSNFYLEINKISLSYLLNIILKYIGVVAFIIGIVRYKSYFINTAWKNKTLYSQEYAQINKLYRKKITLIENELEIAYEFLKKFQIKNKLKKRIINQDKAYFGNQIDLIPLAQIAEENLNDRPSITSNIASFNSQLLQNSMQIAFRHQKYSNSLEFSQQVEQLEKNSQFNILTINKTKLKKVLTKKKKINKYQFFQNNNSFICKIPKTRKQLDKKRVQVVKQAQKNSINKKIQKKIIRKHKNKNLDQSFKNNNFFINKMNKMASNVDNKSIQVVKKSLLQAKRNSLLEQDLIFMLCYSHPIVVKNLLSEKDLNQNQKYYNQNKKYNIKMSADRLFFQMISNDLNIKYQGNILKISDFQKEYHNIHSRFNYCLNANVVDYLLKLDTRTKIIFSYLKEYSQKQMNFTQNDWYKAFVQIEPTNEVDCYGIIIPFSNINVDETCIMNCLSDLDLYSSMEQPFNDIWQHGISPILLKQALIFESLGLLNSHENKQAFNKAKGESIFIKQHQILSVEAFQLKKKSKLNFFLKMFNIEYERLPTSKYEYIPNWIQLHYKNGIIILEGIPTSSDFKQILIRIYDAKSYIIIQYNLKIINANEQQQEHITQQQIPLQQIQNYQITSKETPVNQTESQQFTNLVKFTQFKSRNNRIIFLSYLIFISSAQELLQSQSTIFQAQPKQVIITNENSSVVPTQILIIEDAQLIIFINQEKFIGLYDEVKNKMKIISTSENVQSIVLIDRQQYLLAGMITQASIFQIQQDSNNNDYSLALKQTLGVDIQIFYIHYLPISNSIFIFSPTGLIAVYQYLGSGNMSYQNSFQYSQFSFLSAQATQDESFILTSLSINQIAIFQIEKKVNVNGTLEISNLTYLISLAFDYWIVQLILLKNILYCIDPWQGLYITDLSPLYQNNTQAIKPIKFGLGNINLSPTTQCLTVSSDLKYLYLGVRSQGILIYDISNITNPVFYYQIFVQGQAYCLIISNKGQALYYSNSNGLLQYQQSKLSNINLTPNLYNSHKSESVFDGHPFYKWRCQISQNSNVLYVSFDVEMIQRFQIIKNDQIKGDIILKKIDNLPYATSSVNSTTYIEEICIDKNQNYLYIPVTNDNNIIMKYQIPSSTNIFTPLLYIQSLQYSNPQYAESLKISQDNRYLVLAYAIGVLIVDNEKFEVLSLLNIFEMQSNCYGAEFTRDTNYIFATARNIGVWIIDSRDKKNPFIIQVIKTKAAETVIVSKLYDIMYCLDGFNGLLIFDTSVLPNVKILSHLKLEGWVNYITLLQDENFGIISTMDSGMLSLINLTDKANPYVISSYQQGLQNSFSACVDPSMQYIFILNSQSIRYFPINSDTHIHYEFSVKQTNQSSQVRVVLSQDDYLQVGQIYELRLISLYQQPNQQINNIFLYQNEQKQALPTWINQINKLYLQMAIPKEAISISNNSIITLLVQTQYSLSNSSFIYNSSSFAISPDLSNKIYYYLKTCAFINSYDLVTDLYNPEIPLNFNDFGNDLTDPDQQILALKFVRNTLQNSIDYNPIYFRVQSSLNYIINQSNNTFQVYSISNTISIQLSFSSTSSLVFVQKEYPNVISYRDDQNSTLNLQSSVDSINNVLRENILYHIIENQNNQNKQLQVNLLIQDNINTNIKAQFNVSDLSFLKLKQKVKQLKELQPQVEKVSSDSSFAIESTFIIQFDKNSFIDPDEIPLSYQLKIFKNNDYENILPEYFIKFDEQNLRISGIPQSSNLFETIHLRLVVSNGYNQLYSNFYLEINKISLSYLLNIILKYIGVVAFIIGIVRYKSYFVNRVLKSKTLYSQEFAQINKLYRKKITLIENELQIAYEFLKKFQSKNILTKKMINQEKIGFRNQIDLVPLSQIVEENLNCRPSISSNIMSFNSQLLQNSILIGFKQQNNSNYLELSQQVKEIEKKKKQNQFNNKFINKNILKKVLRKNKDSIFYYNTLFQSKMMDLKKLNKKRILVVKKSLLSAKRNNFQVSINKKIQKKIIRKYKKKYQDPPFQNNKFQINKMTKMLTKVDKKRIEIVKKNLLQAKRNSLLEQNLIFMLCYSHPLVVNNLLIQKDQNQNLQYYNKNKNFDIKISADKLFFNMISKDLHIQYQGNNLKISDFQKEYHNNHSRFNYSLNANVVDYLLKLDTRTNIVYAYLKEYSKKQMNFTQNDWYKAFVQIEPTNEVDCYGIVIPFSSINVDETSIMNCLSDLDLYSSMDQSFNDIWQHGISPVLLKQALIFESLGLLNSHENRQAFNKSKGESIFIKQHQIFSVEAFQVKKKSKLSFFQKIFNIEYERLPISKYQYLPNWIQLDCKNGVIILEGIPTSSDIEQILIRIYDVKNYIIIQYNLKIINVNEQSQAQTTYQHIPLQQIQTYQEISSVAPNKQTENYQFTNLAEFSQLNIKKQGIIQKQNQQQEQINQFEKLNFTDSQFRQNDFIFSPTVDPSLQTFVGLTLQDTYQANQQNTKYKQQSSSYNSFELDNQIYFKNKIKSPQNILGIIPEGLAVINKEKKLLYANPTLKRILKSNKKAEVLQILLNLGNQKVNQQQQVINKPISKNVSNEVQKNNIIAKEKDKLSQQTLKQDQKQQTLSFIEQKDLQIQINSLKKYEINKEITNLNNDCLQIDEKNIIKFVENQDQEGLQNTQSRLNNQNIINQNIEVNMSDSSRLNRETQRLLIEPQQQINNTNQASFNSYNKNLLNISQFGQYDEEQIQSRIRSLSQSRKRENSLSSFYSLKACNKVKKSIRRESSNYYGKAKSPINKQSTLQSVNFGQSEQSDIISYKGFGIQPEKNNQNTDYFKSEGTINESTKNINFEQQELKFQKIQNKPEIMQSSINSLNQQNPNGTVMNYNNSYQKTNSLQRKKYILQSSLKQQSLNLSNNVIKNKNLNISKQISEKLEEQEEEKTVSKGLNFQMADKIKSIKNDFNSSQKFQNNSNYMIQSTKSINQFKKNLLNSKIQTQRNSIKQSNFKLKIKFKKSQTSNNDEQLGQITSKKTDVKKIIENMLEQDSQAKKEQSSQKFTEQERCSKNNSKLQLNDNQKADQQDYQKQTSFSKCVKKQNEDELNYFQQMDTKAKMQVQFQNQDLILEILQVDALVSEEKKDPLVLIIVQDLWKDLYQKKVQDTQKDKMRIFASLSHELRTPLNCSISMLEVIREDIEQINPRLIEEYLNPALFSNKLLLNQINDLLDYVQMDSGKFKYSFYDFNIFNLFNDCKKLISMQAKLKNIEVIIAIGKQVPEMISSDPNRIRQILLNFLSNSLKFTKRGFIEIGITQFDSKKGLLKVYVKDTGIGITKENLETIFDFCGKVNYNQKDQHLNRQGCGLGLTISNSIAKGLVKNEQDDGGIKVESDYGYGSTFSILIQDMSINQQYQKEELTQQTHNNTILEKYSGKLFQSDDNQISSLKQYSYSIKSNFNLQAQIEELTGVRQSKQKINPQIDFVYTLNEQSNSFLSDNSKQYMRNDINKNSSFIHNSSKMEEIQEEQLIQIENGKKNQNIIDSSVIIEYDEDNKKDFKINSNLKIRNYYERFEESEEKNKPQSLELDNQNISQSFLENQEHYFNQNNYAKQKIQLSNQNLKSLLSLKGKQSPMKIQSFENKTFNFRSSSDIFEKSEKIHSFQNEEEVEVVPPNCSEINSQERNSKNYFSNLYTKVKTANTGTIDRLDKSAKEQEGFTSYVGLSKFLDAQLSQQKICSQILDNQEEQVNTNKELQCIQEISQQMNNQESSLDPQQAIYFIKELNQKKKKCGCPQFMIVDDNQFNTYALSKILGQYYFTFQCLSDGFSAIDEVESLYKKNCCKAPKIIFMDIDMPMKNGYETAVEINQFYESVALSAQYLPIIIACTAYVGQEDVDAAMQSGMKDFINKPILKNGLESLILNWKNKFL